MRDPWVILQTISREEIKDLLAEPEFRNRVETLLAKNRESYTNPAWFQKTHPNAGITSVAYFSMEFMLAEALPIYSGGLGNVAGDQMKAASDLGVPVVGVGLLYGQGYFRQDFDAKGRQQTLYPVNDAGQMPVRPLRNPDGQWLRLLIEMPGAAIWLRCWQVSVGRGKLYLLDANDFANSAAHRCITSELYGGDAEMRLKQEIILGIGGWRLLRAVGLNPEVCHLNEGHAAFAVLERARSYMEENNCSFDVALNVTRAGNVFTTHTAVTAGFDRFTPELMRRYLGNYAQEALGLSPDDLLALGRRNPADNAEPFNMAYLAVRGSCRVNGVSKLHGEVSREIFQPLFPRWPREQVPVGSVTNGIHVPTWESAGANELWTEACGKERWLGDLPDSDDIRGVSDERLWKMRNQGRARLIEYLRDRYARQLAGQGMDPAEALSIFDDDILTVGFARRFATYKRPNLLLYDPERLARILNNPDRPMQLVIAGKAHPQDLPGQALIEQWNNFIKRADVRSRVIFLSDYDMLLAKKLVQGMDLWTNTPRRPWEACGTSGMKVLSNGCLNLSELDGWWSEAYTPEVGWAMGDGAQHGNDSAWDVKEANDLYTLLEQQGRSRLLHPHRRRRSDELDRARPGEHGPPHAGVLRQPHHPRLHRAVLPSCRQRLSRTRSVGRRSRQVSYRVEGRGGCALGRGKLRVGQGRADWNRCCQRLRVQHQDSSRRSGPGLAAGRTLLPRRSRRRRRDQALAALHRSCCHGSGRSRCTCVLRGAARPSSGLGLHRPHHPLPLRRRRPHRGRSNHLAALSSDT